MSEAGDFTPAWGDGHDFSSARRAYDVHAGRSYDDAKAKGKDLKDVVPTSITTAARAALVIVADQTGSMADWPAVMFSKLPYLDHEAREEYLGTDVEFSFAAIGDARSTGTNKEDYPLQIRPFSKGADMKSELEALIMEKKGGGTKQETYELAALYYARNASLPNAVNPIIIFIGDESPYDMITKADAKQYARIDIESNITTKRVFDELKQKFAVYLVKKPYDGMSGDRMSATDQGIFDDWAALIGADHIAILPSADRVVDVIFGILAKEAGRVGYFKDEIAGRQRPEQVLTVMKSLKTVLALPGPKKGGAVVDPGKSRLAGRKGKDDSDELDALA